jgi:hypothetical protein
MKKLIITTAIALSFLGARAQYGKLEPLKPGDTIMVLRTSKDTLEKIKHQSSKLRALAGRIETVEESLDYERAIYLHQKPKGFYEPQLPGLIGMFQRDNVTGVDCYIKEYLFYHPEYKKDHTVKKP